MKIIFQIKIGVSSIMSLVRKHALSNAELKNHAMRIKLNKLGVQVVSSENDTRKAMKERGDIIKQMLKEEEEIQGGRRTIRRRTHRNHKTLRKHRNRKTRRHRR
jgi:hypothetical protein